MIKFYIKIIISVLTRSFVNSQFKIFHIYSVKCKNRDKLQKFLIKNDIDAKIHYPVPMHLQPAARYLGYKKGDFPISENLSKTTISFPVHEFISKTELKKIVSTVKNFYK